MLIGGGGADRLSGGAGADTFQYLSVSDSTPASTDLIIGLEHGMDKIDLTAVAGGVVNIVHDGAGGGILYYAPDGAEAGGVINVSGDVEDADVIVSSGTIFIDTGAFAGAFETAPDPQPRSGIMAFNSFRPCCSDVRR